MQKKDDRSPEIVEMPDLTQDIATELKTLVRHHRVCWEVRSEQIPVEGDKPREVGFNLLLFGAHEDHPPVPPLPGCDKCREIYRDLHKLASWILPKEQRPSRYDIDVFDNAIRYDPERRGRADIELAIKIIHRSHYEAPVDECEVRCLNDMKTRLQELGVQHKRWREGEG